ncbi:MAG: hypothetical protein ACJAV6_000149 [Candidatus Paceibacteria bacterium]|jgi:hypothetical protein
MNVFENPNVDKKYTKEMVDYLEDKSTKEGILGSTNDTATRLEEWKDKLEKLEEQEHKPAA